MLLMLEKTFESFRGPQRHNDPIGYFFVVFTDSPCDSISFCKFAYAFRLVSCSWILHILSVTPCLLFPSSSISYLLMTSPCWLAGATLCELQPVRNKTELPIESSV